jgi:hypothetical protein
MSGSMWQGMETGVMKPQAPFPDPARPLPLRDPVQTAKGAVPALRRRDERSHTLCSWDNCGRMDCSLA